MATKNVPNILSLARIPLSLMLLVVKPFSTLFTFIYVLCGATDALDGYLARAYHVESALGARLDSAADFTFFAVALYVFLTFFEIPMFLIVWAFALVALRFTGLFLALDKYHAWPALHTYAYKVCGFVFFCFPVLVAFLGTLTAGVVLCGLATYATGEELYINQHASEFDPNIAGAFEINRKALRE